jgi:hypothetical protein
MDPNALVGHLHGNSSGTMDPGKSAASPGAALELVLSRVERQARVPEAAGAALLLTD